MKTKILSTALALSMLGTTAAMSVNAEEPEQGTKNVTITTSVNGNGVVTHFDGKDLVTDTFTVGSGVLSTPSPETTETPTASSKPDADKSEDESPLYETYFFKLLKQYIFSCMDEYYAEHDGTEAATVPTAFPEPTAAPTAAPTTAPTSTPVK